MQRILAVLVCLCIVVQPLVVRVHLALEDHTHASGNVAVAAHDHRGHASHHGHHGPRHAAPHGHIHRHAHAHPHAHPHGHDAGTGGIGEDGHPPHPAEDHLCQQPEQLPAPPAPVLDAPDLPPPGPGDWDVVVRAPLPQRGADVPQRPPPCAPALPRAPPAIV